MAYTTLTHHNIHSHLVWMGLKCKELNLKLQELEENFFGIEIPYANSYNNG